MNISNTLLVTISTFTFVLVELAFYFLPFFIFYCVTKFNNNIKKKKHFILIGGSVSYALMFIQAILIFPLKFLKLQGIPTICYNPDKPKGMNDSLFCSISVKIIEFTESNYMVFIICVFYILTVILSFYITKNILESIDCDKQK